MLFSKEEGKLRAEIAKNGGINEDIKAKIEAFNDKKDAYNKSLGDAKLVGDNRDENGILMHRAGFDITVSAPKSLSILALVGGDERLKDALVEANKEVLEYAEKHFAQGRVWNSELKSQERVDTGNLMVAQYLHSTSRSVDGQTPDPQLHIHNFVSNITKTEQGYRALEPRELYRHQNMLGQVAQNAMAEKVQKLGYEVEWTKQKNGNYTFEIKGVDKELIDNFSKRTEVIEKAIQKAELESGRELSAAEKDIVTADTKSSKEKQNLDELKDKWAVDAQRLGHTKESMLESATSQNGSKKIAATAEEALAIGSKTLEIQTSVFDKHQLLHEAAKASQGQFSLGELESSINKTPGVVALNDKYLTTERVIEAEKSILEKVESGKMAVTPLMSDTEFAKKTENSPSFNGLTEGQKQALAFIATTSDNVVAIQGDAGTGKTTMFKELGQMLSEAKTVFGSNTEIVALAPTGKASSAMFKEAGLESQTIDRFLLQPTENTKQERLYIVDEASMIPTLKLAALLEKAELEGARIVLTGDIKQLAPVEQGSMFAKLQNDDLISKVEMTEVLRQKTEITQEYAKSFKEGNIETAFEKLEQSGCLIQNADTVALRENIISNAISDIKEYGLESVAVLANSNQMKSYLNEGIRNELISAGILNSENSITINALEAKQLSKLDALIATNYEPGDVMFAHKMQGDIKSGDEVRVLEVNQETNQILIGYENSKGESKERWIDAEKAAEAYNLYGETERELTVGDKIAFTRNDGELKNGEQAIITDIDSQKGVITVDKDGQDIKIDIKEYRNIDYGYATTTHKSQGMTAEHVHIYAEADTMQNFNSGYVEATRAKEDVHLYVNDKDAVIENYMDAQEKLNATDIKEDPTATFDKAIEELTTGTAEYFDKKLEVAIFEVSLAEMFSNTINDEATSKLNNDDEINEQYERAQEEVTDDQDNATEVDDEEFEEEAACEI
jgi:conjugative relaxase-like TrwC/TraI family protein